MKFIKSTLQRCFPVNAIKEIFVDVGDDDGKEYFVINFDTVYDDEEVLANADFDTKEEAEEALEKLIDSLKTCRFLRVNGVMINVENIVEAKVIPPSDMTRTDRYEVRLFYRGVGNDYYRPEGLKLQAATLGIYDTPERAYERLDELMDQLND